MTQFSWIRQGIISQIGMVRRTFRQGRYTLQCDDGDENYNENN